MQTKLEYMRLCWVIREALDARAWPPTGIVLRADVFDCMLYFMNYQIRPAQGVPKTFYGIPVHKGDGMIEEFIFLTT